MKCLLTSFCQLHQTVASFCSHWSHLLQHQLAFADNSWCQLFSVLTAVLWRSHKAVLVFQPCYLGSQSMWTLYINIVHAISQLQDCILLIELVPLILCFRWSFHVIVSYGEHHKGKKSTYALSSVLLSSDPVEAAEADLHKIAVSITACVMIWHLFSPLYVP